MSLEGQEGVGYVHLLESLLPDVGLVITILVLIILGAERLVQLMRATYEQGAPTKFAGWPGLISGPVPMRPKAVPSG